MPIETSPKTVEKKKPVLRLLHAVNTFFNPPYNPDRRKFLRAAGATVAAGAAAAAGAKIADNYLGKNPDQIYGMGREEIPSKGKMADAETLLGAGYTETALEIGDNFGQSDSEDLYLITSSNKRGDTQGNVYQLESGERVSVHVHKLDSADGETQYVRITWDVDSSPLAEASFNPNRADIEHNGINNDTRRVDKRVIDGESKYQEWQKDGRNQFFIPIILPSEKYLDAHKYANVSYEYALGVLPDSILSTIYDDEGKSTNEWVSFRIRTQEQMRNHFSKIAQELQVLIDSYTHNGKLSPGAKADIEERFDFLLEYKDVITRQYGEEIALDLLSVFTDQMWQLIEKN